MGKDKDKKEKEGKEKKKDKESKAKSSKGETSQRSEVDDIAEYGDLFYYGGDEDEEEERETLKRIFKSSSRVNLSDQDKKKKIYLCRSLIGFWLLGFTNNFCYMFILSAALDILQKLQGSETKEPKVKLPDERDCNEESAGLILVIVATPGILLKVVLPFIPLMIKLKLATVVSLNIIGLCLLAFVENYYVIMASLILMSLASEIGESSFLQFSTYYSKFVISAWSSGTGAASFVSAASFASIMLIFGFKTATLIFLSTPVIMVISFLVLPRIDPTNSQFILDSRSKSSINIIKKKMKIIPIIKWILFHYTAISFLIYFTTQGVFDIIYFENINMVHNSQYRWFIALYSFGNFVSRSTGQYWVSSRVWIFTVTLFICFCIFLFEAIFVYMPWIYIMFVLTFGFGFVGGGAFVCNFFNIKLNVKTEFKQFTTTVCTVCSSSSILLAGACAIPLHNFICGLKKMERVSF